TPRRSRSRSSSRGSRTPSTWRWRCSGSCPTGASRRRLLVGSRAEGDDMRVDAGLMGGLAEVPARIKELEAAGFDGAMTAETAHDPFVPLFFAAEHSQRIELITSIAVAFARNPMILANVAHDLNSFSKGRFILGLGSQIQPHIQKRFSMPWSH